jgi:hypothetical protein
MPGRRLQAVEKIPLRPPGRLRQRAHPLAARFPQGQTLIGDYRSVRIFSIEHAVRDLQAAGTPAAVTKRKAAPEIWPLGDQSCVTRDLAPVDWCVCKK